MTLDAKAKLEIAELGTAFAALLDERRFPEVAALFAENGILHRADGTVIQGREAILAAQSSRHEDVDTVHHVANPFIEPVDSRNARGRTSFVAVSINRQDGTTQGWAIGYFDDRYCQHDGRWRFAERRIHLTHRR